MTTPVETATAVAAGHRTADDAPAYRCRAGVLEGEATWRLAADALERREDGAPPWRLRYRDVTELRLSYDPTRFETNRFRCDLRTRAGERATSGR